MTIVALIILATISVNAALGKNGIIKTAKQKKDEYESELEEKETSMHELLKEYNDAIVEPCSPKLTNGMTKVKYNSTSGKWEKVINDNEEWYNYDQKKWANVVLGDATFNGNILDETRPYTQLVWIPRYAYKITSMYHQRGNPEGIAAEQQTAGNIEIVFIDTANKSEEGITYSTTYPAATVGGSMADFVVHPAFNYGGQKLVGFWVGKFESSNTGCTTDKLTGEIDYTGNEVMTVKANVTSWRKIKIGQSFATCLNMNKVGNPYGLNTNDAIVDPHMMKNDEWGAVAYLSKSRYGKQNEEVWNNPNANYITGMAGSECSSWGQSTTNQYNTTTGVKASTTGNVYGIYDMSGGNWERVAAYIEFDPNTNASLKDYGGELVAGTTPNKYRNVYSRNSTDTAQENYTLSTPANGHYGDAIYETSDQGNNASAKTAGGSIAYGIGYSWCSDYCEFPRAGAPFFGRGGCKGNGWWAGLFWVDHTDGSALPGGLPNDGFRVVVPVL